MKQTHSNADNLIARNQQVSLLELLDRLLDKGVILKGEILLSVAGIDLVYLNLGLLLSSVKTAANSLQEDEIGRDDARDFWSTSLQNEGVTVSPSITEINEVVLINEGLDIPQTVVEVNEIALVGEALELPLIEENRQSTCVANELIDGELTAGTADDQCFEPKANIDPQNVEEGLTKLVLTVIDLVRKLMEKQAIRRIEAGQVSTREIERVADTFFLLDQKMEQLKEAFGLQDEELNLDLGPLGELI